MNRKLVEQPLEHAHGNFVQRTLPWNISRPAALTSTVAADMLGVSRLALMKWVSEKNIESFAVGTHARLSRGEVLRMKEHRTKDRRAAFEELLELDAEHEGFLDN